MSEKGYTKITVSLPPELIDELPGGELPPEWMRVSFIDEDSPKPDIERVFIPLEVFGNAMELFLCACFDGVPMVQSDNHNYVPASWIMGNRPDLEEQIAAIVGRVIEMNHDDPTEQG